MKGNRCGHDPAKIRRSLRRGGGRIRLPLVLEEGGRAFARAIVERPRDFPELLDVTKDSNRKRRSERLEVIGLVVMALIVRTDLASLVVRWEGDGLPEKTIARWTGCTARRVRRALHDLRWAGLVRGPGKFGPNRIKQPCETYDPRETKAGRCTRVACWSCKKGKPHVRAKPAIRQLTIGIFKSTGRDGWLRNAQAARYAATTAKPRRPEMSAAARALQVASFAREARLLAGTSERERPPPD